LSNGEQNNVPHSHREGDAVIFDPPEDQREAARGRREYEQHEFARAQVRTNQRLARFSLLLVVGTFGGIGIGFWQATISQTAVNVASHTLDETVRSNKAQELASTASFQATVDSARLDQRAWVGVVGVNAVGVKADEDSFGIQSLSIVIRNSGKTPALKMSASNRGGVKLHSDPFPDYETIWTEPQRRLEELKRKNPQFAAAIAQMQQKTIRSTSEDMVLPPNAAQELIVATNEQWSTNIEHKSFSGMVQKDPLTIYFLGKILYSDVFTGTPQRSTKFCLMRTAPASSFSICPAGNSMK
jgi:hypothetical protein